MARVKGNDKDGQVKLMYIDEEGSLEPRGGRRRLRVHHAPKGGWWRCGATTAVVIWDAACSICVRKLLRRELEERRLRAWTCCADAFTNKETGVRVVVWGDDFTFLGRERYLKEIGAKMAEWYDIKIRGMMGPEAGDDKEIRILNRVVKWESDKLIYEADDKHVTNISSSWASTRTPRAWTCRPPRTTTPRATPATINYLASDRPDLQFTASMLGRTMGRPTTRSWYNLKKAARYLKEHPRVKYEYHDVTMDEVKELVGYSDSDWAGCKRSRQSMSGGMTVVGGVIKSWSNRQATVALSSGEAEFYSAGKAAAELIGIKSMMRDMGWDADIKLRRTGNGESPRDWQDSASRSPDIFGYRRWRRAE